MASFGVQGLDGLELSFHDLAELPDEIVDAMLDAEADVALAAQKAEAEQLGMYSGYGTIANNARDTSESNTLPGQVKSYSTGELARSVKKARPKAGKDGRTQQIYFSGSRKRGKTVTKNSEIAFLNEFGTRTINARRFIWVANRKCADAAVAAAAKVYDRWLKAKKL